MAWLDRIANMAMMGDATLADELGRRTLEVQETLAAPEEAKRTFDDWIAVRAELLVRVDPSKVLERHELTLPAWLRLDRRFARACDADPALARDADVRTDEARI